MTKMIKCRIALAVDPSGGWSAAGHNVEREPAKWEKFDYILDGIDDGEARYWIEVEVPVPETTTVQGIVTEAK
jgi:hypothetical protein